MQGEKSKSTVPRNSRISSYTALEPIKDISTINTTSGFMTEQHEVRRAIPQVLRGSTVWFEVLPHPQMSSQGWQTLAVTYQTNQGQEP